MSGQELAPVIVSVMMFMIPIVYILVKHQQKMAIIMRTQAPQLANPDTDLVRRELAELKGLMHQQAIAIDDLSRKVEASTELSQRLEKVTT